MSSQACKRFVDDVESIGFLLIDLIAKDRRVKGDDPSKAAAGLLARMAEQFVACIAILRSPAPSDSMTVLRSLVEAQADYFCLLGEPVAHWKRMELTAANGFVDVIEGFLADPETHDDVDEGNLKQLGFAKKVVDGLKGAGVTRDKSKFEKFKRAGLAPNYLAFQFLCSPTHTDLNAVTARHVRGDNRLVVFDELPSIMVRSLCAVMVAALSQCVERFPTISDLPEEQVKAVLSAVDERWKQSVAALDEAEGLQPMK